MRLIGRACFLYAAALLWLAAAAVALETWGAYQYQRILRDPNPAPVHPGWTPPLRTDQNQPSSNTVANVVPSAAPSDALQSKIQNPKSKIDSTPTEDHLGTWFASLSEDDRAMYATLQEALIAVYDRDGNAVSTYGQADVATRFGLSPDYVKSRNARALFPDDNADIPGALRRMFDDAKPGAFNVDVESSTGLRKLSVSLFPLHRPGVEVTGIVCMFGFPMNLTLTDTMAQDQAVPPDSEWKVPWREYKKHFRKSPDSYTNNLGLWDDEVALPRPAGVFRIACVGGSTTVEGPSNALTYPNILERKLNARFRDAKIEVINCGVHGLDSPHERKKTLDYILMQPNLVVQYNFVNDCCYYFFWLWEQNTPTWWHVLRRSRFIDLYGDRLLLPPRERIIETIEQKTLKNYRIMHECFRSRGVEMAICSFAHPDYETLSADEVRFFEYHLKTYWKGDWVTLRSYCHIVEIYNERVRALCRELGIHYIPVAENVRGGTNYFMDICHMTDDGIERKAQVIFDDLESFLPPKLATPSNAGNRTAS